MRSQEWWCAATNDGRRDFYTIYESVGRKYVLSAKKIDDRWERDRDESLEGLGGQALWAEPISDPSPRWGGAVK